MTQRATGCLRGRAARRRDEKEEKGKKIHGNGKYGHVRAS